MQVHRNNIGGLVMKLLEVGKDFEIKIRGYSGAPKYKVVRRLTLKHARIRIPLKGLKEKVENLKKRYPDKGYFLTRTRYKGRVYWRFGRKEPNLKGIPLYYSSTLGKLYVPKTYLDKKYKLVCSVIMYRLRDLRIPYHLKNC